jgi:hypothetical protein
MRVREILVVYLKERVIVFPLHLYINTFINKILNKLRDWELLTNKKISGKEKYFKFFVEKEINDILLEIKIVYKDLNIKIFTIYQEDSQKQNKINYSEYFIDESLIKNYICSSFKKTCKKYFSKNIPQELKFKPTDKLFKGFKCGVASGAEIEFLSKLNKCNQNF